MFEGFANSFKIAATALATGKMDTGVTGTGVRKLDFKDGDKVFTAIEQNPNRLSTGAALAKQGHSVVQIRDNNIGQLIGNVTDGKFTPYALNVPPVDIQEVARALKT